jgi:4-hydroxy-tetrahydrodipicolinate reductase
MKIALIGTGKMGQAIEQLAIGRGHEIVLKLNHENIDSFNNEEFKSADVAIEFTRPDAAIGNLKRCLAANIPVVCGTTGWYNELNQITDLFNNENGSLVYASNFSVGVNMMFELNRILAKWMQSHQEYNVSLSEIHHIHKLDKPSGTAVTLASGIIENNNHYTNWALDHKNENAIYIDAQREPDVIGTHDVKWESPIDIIQLHHHAKSRDGFALGALHAAEWIVGKKGVYTMKDILFGNTDK